MKVCSLGARGLWVAMICLMHKADPYGHLLVNGKPPDAKRLSAVIGCATEKEVSALLGALESEGVFSRTDNGVIYCRRMVRDKEKSDTGKQYGSTGGNPALRGGVKGAGLSPVVNGQVGCGIREGLVTPRAQEAEAEAEAKPRGFTGGLEQFVTTEASTGRQVCGRWYLQEVVDRVYDAAKIDNARWMGNYGPVIQWLHDGVEPDEIVSAIVKCAKRPGYTVPDRLTYFEKPVKAEAGKRKAN